MYIPIRTQNPEFNVLHNLIIPRSHNIRGNCGYAISYVDFISFA